MNFVYIGKIVNTHGIKGEIRIKSDFSFKDKAFNINNKLYIGNDKKIVTIKSYRVHKKYDMVTLEGFTDINQVLPLMGLNVYMDKNDLNLGENEYLDSDLIGLDIYCDESLLGKITEVFSPSPSNKVIRFISDGRNYLVPYVQNFVKSIDLLERKMILYTKEGVIECE